MSTKITKRTVDQLLPGSGNLLLWDCDVKGFGVRCRTSGAKYYFVKMRIGRRQRWITIGRHGSPWTPETARREALLLLGLRAAGKDPATERDDHKGGLTIAELANRFLTEHVAHTCKSATADEYQRVISLYICPSLGRHRVIDLTRTDVIQLHQQLRDRPYQANRCLAVLSKMSNLAEAWGLRPDGSNPCSAKMGRLVRDAGEQRKSARTVRSAGNNCGNCIITAAGSSASTTNAGLR